MDDLISRQAAIDALKRKQDDGKGDLSRFYNTIIQHDIEAIMLLPPIQPKRGQWIDDGSELGCQCSQCGKTLDEYINCGTEYMTLTEIPKFCPNCGADMRGEQE